MSKNRNSRMPGNMNYNRPSGGYQKNFYKQQMKAQNIKQPKGLDQKTIRNAGIAIGVVWLIATIALTVTLKWKGLLIGLVIGIIVTGGLWFYLRNKQNEMIAYYKKIGMTEEMYINELRKRNNDVKQIEAARKAWRKVKAESVFQQPEKKKKK
ncbi:MAG: hypothetical protein IJH92_00230 [Mogibacterium sp.]|nr:hypothetical protein [Mogibacterium sp.]